MGKNNNKMESARWRDDNIERRINTEFYEDDQAMLLMLPFDERIFRTRREEILTKFAEDAAAEDINMTLTELNRRVRVFWLGSGVRDSLICFHQEETRRVRTQLD